MKFTLIITYQGCDMFESTKIKKVLRLRSLVRVATIVISVLGATDTLFYRLHSYRYLRYPLETVFSRQYLVMYIIM